MAEGSKFSTKQKALAIIAVTILLAGGLSYSIAQRNVTYYYTVQEISKSPQDFIGKEIRVLGLVVPGSLKWQSGATSTESSSANRPLEFIFLITDESQLKLPVRYSGVKPDMFKEGQGVVVDGVVKVNAHQNLNMDAKTLLVKHSEEYKTNQDHLKDKGKYYESLTAAP